MPEKRKCFICPQVLRKNEKISLHSFPKNPDASSKWRTFCDLMESDNVNKLHICSLHFTADDFVNYDARIRGECLILKFGAVPSILLPIDNAKGLELPITETTTVTQTLFDEQHQSIPIEVVECVHIANNTFATPRKRRFYEPRYIGDIKSPDISTPKRAKRCLLLTKKKIKKQHKQIKLLQQRTRRLKLKVQSMKGIISHLERNNLITSEAADNLMVIPYYIYLDLMSTNLLDYPQFMV
ncbi:hypothetical protein RI129_002991 [Pyrocoelia pectoralis]|uniref:THAP-type domain-containing protein n=1 Tax=Pyrocoelia pectoralis TaxID=417401 RepID=A0AAN7VMY3_9COLE